MHLDGKWATAWLMRCAVQIKSHRIELIEYDRAIGDGDHGENLDRGFTALENRLEQLQPKSVSEVLNLAAMTLIQNIGGASGPLLGTAFLRGAKAVGTEPVDTHGYTRMLQACAEGIKARGKAQTGDKTMVDTWQEAADRAQRSHDAGENLTEVMKASAAGAYAGALGTVQMQAHKGRASYLGERSVGHIDPGAWSSALIIAAAAQAAGIDVEQPEAH